MQKKSTTNNHKPKIIPHFIEKVNSSRFKSFLIPLFLICWTIIILFFTQLALSFIFVIFFDDYTTSASLATLYNALCYAISLFLLIFVPWKLFRTSKPNRENLGLKNLPTFIDLGLAPIGFIAYYLLSSLLITIFSLFPWFNVAEAQDVGFNFLATTPDYIIAFISLVIIAPVAEEIIFRGWLYDRLRTKLPPKISLFLAIILVSAVFGLMHGQWNVGINTFAMSIVLCLIREITGTIYSGIILHSIKNALAFYLVFILGIS